MLRTKLYAFATHLVASLAVVGVYLLLVYFVWYPAPYYELEQVIDVVAILVGVDVVIGPLLTLVIYNPRKPELRRDLAIIIGLQLAAFAWGVSVTYGQRPVYVALVSRTLSVVAADNVDQRALTDPSLQSTGWGGPRLVYVALPRDSAEMAAATADAARTGRKVAFRADKYQALSAHLDRLADSAIDMREHAREYPELQPALERFFATYGGTLDDYYFVGIEGRTKLGLVAMNPRDGTVVAMLDE